MGVNKCLIVASHNIKVKKINSIAIPLFGLPYSLLGLCSIIMGVLRFSLGVRVLHGPKNDQSLCNIIMGVLSLRIGLIEYVLSCVEGIA
jgi:hypothetical protein